jgi:cytochrome c-type biogenesis protein CcmH
MPKPIRFVLALIILASILAAPALAQTPTPNEINAIAKELWCPLCNGVRLDNCELQACIQMREVIAQKLAAGQSKEQIKAYFVQQYGDVVLGMPTGQGFNLVAWGLPLLAGLAALGLLAYVVRLWVRRRPAAGLLIAPGVRPAATPADEYLKRVETELGRDE